MNSSKDKLGYYLVGWKKFHNKTLALLESKKTGYDLVWVFNNDVYGKIDWTIPIHDSLENLYKKRAQQLRDQYDYLVLYFSGGADSLNILHSFINNDIFLDEIVMQVPEPAMSTFNEEDKSNKNLYSEIKYQATPVLNNVKLNPNTKIRYQDISKPFFDLVSNDNWFDTMPLGTNISPAGIARQISQVKEPHILELCSKGKKAVQILGVDKPQVVFKDDAYYVYFSDLNAMHSPPVDFTQREIFNDLYTTEFFYWSRDLPEIVVKQAQIIKAYCETDINAREIIMSSMKKHVQHLKPLLHSLIYSKEVKIKWDPEKPTSKIVRPMDQWFWELASEKQKNNYLETIEYIKENTFTKHMIDQDIGNGLSAHTTGFYKL
jgi:hypothetical protein